MAYNYMKVLSDIQLRKEIYRSMHGPYLAASGLVRANI
jgi:hypothetical protein